MEIIPSENVSGQVRAGSGGHPEPPQPKAKPARRAAAEGDYQPVPELRKQLLVVQRSLGRNQSVLAGLEGFKVLLDADATQATDYIGNVTYRGQAVLQPHGAELKRILAEGDLPALQRLIEDTRTEIRGLALTLGRLQTAEQNSRSIVLGQASLTALLEGIRDRGDQALDLEGKNVLDLLG